MSYFVHDHLGNTRIVYHTVLECDQSEVNYILEHTIDYYPYGKVLREHTNCEDARYLTTHHERDKETGSDYRGARFYDSDIGRFLSLDPLATDFAAWSPYNYVLGNPIVFVDPDGKAPKAKTDICPQCISGAVIGALADIVGQIAAGMAFTGHDFKTAVKKINLWSTSNAAITGFISGFVDGGASKIASVFSKERNRKVVGLIAEKGLSLVLEFVNKALNEIASDEQIDEDTFFKALMSFGLGELAGALFPNKFFNDLADANLRQSTKHAERSIRKNGKSKNFKNKEAKRAKKLNKEYQINSLLGGVPASSAQEFGSNKADDIINSWDEKENE